MGPGENGQNKEEPRAAYRSRDQHLRGNGTEVFRLITLLVISVIPWLPVSCSIVGLNLNLWLASLIDPLPLFEAQLVVGQLTELTDLTDTRTILEFCQYEVIHVSHNT